MVNRDEIADVIRVVRGFVIVRRFTSGLYDQQILKTEMRRRLALLPFEEKIRKVAELIVSRASSKRNAFGKTLQGIRDLGARIRNDALQCTRR